MKKIIISFLLPLLLASCDHLGSTRVKNLIDLTPRLEVETSAPLKIIDGRTSPFSDEATKSYKLSRHTIIAKPAIAKGAMYSIDKEGYVSAFSLKEKKILWAADIAKGSLDRNFNTGGILFSDGKLYVTNSSRYLVVLDANTGREIIRKEFPDILRVKPIMANEHLLLVQTISNQLIAYDIRSSKLVWINEGGMETISTRSHAHPVVYNDHVLVSYSSGEILYLDIHTGQEKWRYNLASTNDVGIPSFDPSVIVTTPILSNNYAYFATSNGKVIKIDLDNGAPAWLRTADDVQSMSLVGGNLFITNNARQIAALSAHNGKISWVGNLISIKDRNTKKPKTALFQEPFVSKTNTGFAVNVIASNGELYQFNTNASGDLPVNPNIIKIDNNEKYHWISCCTGKLHLISNNHVKF